MRMIAPVGAMKVQVKPCSWMPLSAAPGLRTHHHHVKVPCQSIHSHIPRAYFITWADGCGKPSVTMKTAAVGKEDPRDSSNSLGYCTPELHLPATQPAHDLSPSSGTPDGRKTLQSLLISPTHLSHKYHHKQQGQAANHPQEIRCDFLSEPE